MLGWAAATQRGWEASREGGGCAQMNGWMGTGASGEEELRLWLSERAGGKRQKATKGYVFE